MAFTRVRVGGTLTPYIAHAPPSHTLHTSSARQRVWARHSCARLPGFIAHTLTSPTPPTPQVPAGASEHAADARACLASLLGSGAPMLAHVVSREKAGPKDRHPKWANGRLSVVLLEAGSGVNMAGELLAGRCCTHATSLPGLAGGGGSGTGRCLTPSALADVAGSCAGRSC